jgi:hypothetical protein
MRHKTAVLTLIVCLTILVGFNSWSLAAPGQAQIANLEFSGPVSQADREYLGLKSSGNFSLQDIQAPYILIEILRTT